MPKQGNFGKLMHIPRPTRRSTRLQTRASLAEPQNRFMHLEGLMQIRIDKELQVEEENEERDEKIEAMHNTVGQLATVSNANQDTLYSMQARILYLEASKAQQQARITSFEAHVEGTKVQQEARIIALEQTNAQLKAKIAVLETTVIALVGRHGM